MPELDDQQLLAEFTAANSETAFATLVARYVNLVYSTALRFAGNPQAAEEISQAVFIILSRKAAALRRGVVLSGWLYQTARLTAANYVKQDIRRQRREQEAYMQSTLNEPGTEMWNEIAPLLDEAMGGLGETDRNAIVLRFFENKTSREVAVALKTTEAAAHMRVHRALEKLHKLLTKRGVVSTTAIIAGAVSANSVHAAPVGLTQTISTVALAKGAAASTSTLTLVKGALKVMAWTHAKTAIVVGAGILLAAGTTTVVVTQIQHHSTYGISDKIPDNDMAIYWNSSKLYALPSNILALRQSHYPEQRGSIVAVQGGLLGKQECRMAGAGMSLRNILCMAYLASPVRMILPPDVPQGRFDFLITLPATNQMQQTARLQKEITRQFGLAGQNEMIETNVLLLQLASGTARGFTPHVGQGSTENDMKGKRYVKGQGIGVIAGTVEYTLNEPVIDETGMKGNYDFVLDQKFFNGEASREEIEKMLMDQFGMELVPATQPVDMLVVENSK